VTVRRCAALALVAGTLAAAHARADGVAVAIDVAAAFVPHLDLSLTVTNPGPAAVADVSFDVTYLRRRQETGSIGHLAGGARHSWQGRLPPPPGPGTFPVGIRLRYRDAAGTPRETLALELVSTPGALPSPVVATLTPHTVARLGSARLVLDNRAAEKIAGRAALALASPLGTEPESFPLELAAGGRALVPFVIDDLGATPGERYPAYALFEYELDGQWGAVAAHTVLPVASGAAPGRRRPLIVGAMAVAGTLTALGVAWHRAARRRATSSGG
jgi:hypothetical protein